MADSRSEATPAVDNSKVFTIIAALAAMAAAKVSMTLLNKGWTATTGKNPPTDPTDPDTGLGEAALWAVATGAGVALARLFAQRKAAQYYAKSTSKLSS